MATVYDKDTDNTSFVSRVLKGRSLVLLHVSRIILADTKINTSNTYDIYLFLYVGTNVVLHMSHPIH